MLIVDDDRGISRVWAKVLSHDGHDVVRARSLGEARTALQAHRFDVVLLDLMLEGETGEDLLPALSALSPHPGVAAVSGHFDAGRQVRLQQQGVLVVSKPVGERVLRDLVAGLSVSESAFVEAFGAEFKLSQQETALVKLAADHVPDAEMPARLGCNHSTIRTYWSRIRHKTGAQSRLDVLALLASFTACHRLATAAQCCDAGC